MTINNIVAQIDAEIARLEEARALLSGDGHLKLKVGSLPSEMAATRARVKRGRRRFSPEARARIAEGQRKRWAAQRQRKNKAHSSA